jgi:NAD(P)-dependent dehydrogenase (short-subunit alcohol dehydrogenase family)
MNNTQKPVAIVTGASSGIGLGVTQALIKHGYDVGGTSLSISKSKELKASSDLVLIDGDISKKETTVTVAAAAIGHFRRIDMLVNIDAVLYLQNATFVTGENIRVDGGIHAGR